MKYIYITAFTILGILVQSLVYAEIEIWYITLLINDFTGHSLSFILAEWLVTHSIVGIVLFIVGAICGYWQGRYWWKKIYGDRS